MKSDDHLGVLIGLDHFCPHFQGSGKNGSRAGGESLKDATVITLISIPQTVFRLV